MQVDNTWPLVITGYSLGGSIASLFTLWLLEIINGSTSKHPFCITFGAPLIRDPGVQAGLENSRWNSCFLHVTAREDPVLKLFISPDYRHIIDSAFPNRSYKPFGTFLLCSEFGCTWFEEPETLSEFLVAMGLESAGIQILEDDNLLLHYGNILKVIGSMLILKGSSGLDKQIRHSLEAGIVLKLEAIGIKKPQPQQIIDPSALMTRMEKLEKPFVFDPSKKLNKMKIYMAELEWYKKDCRDKQIGYYDSYKNKASRSDIKVARNKRMLTNYWKEMVAEANKKPQKEGASFRTRWLYAGTNYRRMIEPLEIAEYYKERGQEDYIRKGRCQHFVQLEEWLKEAEKPSGSSSKLPKQNLANLLTFDSCFWARVEEALISCKMWMDEGCNANERILLRDKLIEFEQYTMELIENYEVSPEIFLEHSSFMQWWRQYEKIIGNWYHSRFTSFMKNCNYLRYDKSD
ncbi:senescence-associated carboxylesterase 101 [Carica papaya]|uniref:senescence-associated carboxylesterase 101 n=1 Tax=Carica papaya TaxID=3649 RepID=UPI000B8CE053|nr:senescence-associated carboxylesterase 101 [Carica papaya]